MRISFVRGKTLKVSSSCEHSVVDFRFMYVFCRFVGASRFMHELRLGSQNVKDMSVKGGVCNYMRAPSQFDTIVDVDCIGCSGKSNFIYSLPRQPSWYRH